MRMTRKITGQNFFLPALLAAATVTSASFASGALGEGEGNRASKLLTEDLAKDVLGCGVKPNTSNNSQDEVTGEAWVSRAGYSASSSSRPVPQLTLLIRHAKSSDQAKNVFDSSKTAFGGVDVSGLGAPAYRTKVPAQLNVLLGKNWLILSAGTFAKPDTENQEKLAKQLIAKIGDQSLD